MGAVHRYNTKQSYFANSEPGYMSFASLWRGMRPQSTLGRPINIVTTTSPK